MGADGSLPDDVRNDKSMKNQRVLLQAIIALLVVVSGLLLFPRRMVHAAHDATTVITTCDEATLRTAITNAASGDTIQFKISGSPCTITLTAGTLVINNNLTFDASGSPQPVTISGNNAVRVLQVNFVTFTLNALTIANGSASSDVGGGIYNNGGTVTISNSTFANNSAFNGGGLYNAGTTTISNSTFANNSASNAGGGLFNDSMTTISNSTFANNSAPSGAGGIYHDIGTTIVSNSIVANNSGDNCSGGITDGGYNLESGTNCGFTQQQHSLSSTDPKLASVLANNGGPTQTLALSDGSPAINKIPTNACAVPTDQRGVSRPQGPACDIGAFEFRVPTLSLPSSPLTVKATSAQGATVTYTVTASLPDDPNSSPTVSCTPPSGSTFPVGTTTVQCTASDKATPPDVTTGSFQVIVQSAQPPVLNLPAPIIVNATSPQGATVTYTVTASDPVYLPGQLTITCTPPSGSVFPIGTTTVQCTATNPASKVSTGSFQVLVKGAIPQIYDLLTLIERTPLPSELSEHLEHSLARAVFFLQQGQTYQACKQLSAFVRQVRGLPRYSPPLANELWHSAIQIMSVVGCQFLED
jgi:hypothetical protein